MRIGLGMAALGRPGYINLSRDTHLPSRTVEGMQSQANAVMDELFERAAAASSKSGEKNVPWLDCARSYGLSEKFVGEYLRSRNVSPDDVYVSSKWGYTYVADWNVELDDGAPHEVKDHSLPNFLKQVEETREFVGDYLRLYQVHSATMESGILTNTDVHEALHKCRQEHGWKLGLSVSGTNQDEIIRRAMEITVGEPPVRLFDSVQCTYNVLEQKPGTALLEARESGMDIIIKEGLANGRTLRHPRLAELSERMGCGADQLALGAVLAQPFRPRVLSGAVTTDQLSSNLGAVGVCERLTTTDEGRRVLEEVMDGCRMDSEEYWKDRSALRWN